MRAALASLLVALTAPCAEGPAVPAHEPASEVAPSPPGTAAEPTAPSAPRAATPPTVDGPAPTTVPEGAVRFLGRVDVAGHRFAWPGSGFVVAFEGTALVASFEDTLFEDVIHDTDRLRVTVDGQDRVVPLVEGRSVVPLARGLPPGRHLVTVRKRTESEAGTVTLVGLAAPAGRLLPPPPPAARRVLAIGDSITAGYGLDGADAHCHYDASTSDATGSYVATVAEALAAELHVVAWSGRGVARNYDPTLPETMPELFERRLATEPSPRFDHATFVPDVVVVNLGTNDLSPPGANPRGFAPALRRFVNRLRALYPDARIVLAVGPMLADDYPPGVFALRTARRAAAQAVEARRARGDERIDVLEFHGAMPDEGYACDFHPSRATHARMAAALLDHVRAYAAEDAR